MCICSSWRIDKIKRPNLKVPGAVVGYRGCGHPKTLFVRVTGLPLTSRRRLDERQATAILEYTYSKLERPSKRSIAAGPIERQFPHDCLDVKPAQRSSRSTGYRLSIDSLACGSPVTWKGFMGPQACNELQKESATKLTMPVGNERPARLQTCQTRTAYALIPHGTAISPSSNPNKPK